MLHCYTVTLLHCYTVTLLHCYTVTLLHCYTVTLMRTELLIRAHLVLSTKAQAEPEYLHSNGHNEYINNLLLMDKSIQRFV